MWLGGSVVFPRLNVEKSRTGPKSVSSSNL